MIGKAGIERAAQIGRRHVPPAARHEASQLLGKNQMRHLDDSMPIAAKMKSPQSPERACRLRRKSWNC
jgi:hypothetical protein